MAIFTPKTNIVLSLVVAAGCIVAAFFLSGRATLTPANAQSTQELLREYAVKDTDADGLPDWQESLYGSDPANPNSIDSSMTDKEAVAAGKAELRFRSEEATESFENVPGIPVAPNTLTERFAQEFFGKYLATHGEGVPSEEALTAFVNDAIASLDESEPPRFAASDMGSAPAGMSLNSYVVTAETALLAKAIQAEQNEIFYFSDVVHKDDASALLALKAISDSYGAVADAFATVPAPSEVRAKQLRTANALARMSDVIGKMAAFKTDPLLAFVGLGQYEDAAFGLAAAFAEYKPTLDAAGLTYEQGEAGYQFRMLVETSARAKR